MTRSGFVVALVALILAEASAPSTSHACGGCFAPTGAPSVVQAHRMVIALSEARSILWDQFEYAGAPEDFVWVLPVYGGSEVEVTLADNAFFQALAVETQITLRGPIVSTSSGCQFVLAGGADDGALPPPQSPPVSVYYQGVVGPYETVTIGAADGGALVEWLTDHQYNVPDAMLPTIEYYVERNADFVVLRLQGKVGVSRIEPVRVSMPGLNVAFPLRMVAAGVAEDVAIDLYVFGQGRYEPANFPSTAIDPQRLQYDLRIGAFNYGQLAEEALEGDGGRTWLVEFAREANPFNFETVSIVDEDGNSHDAHDDWAAVTAILPRPYLTRLRASLPVEALTEDLILHASSDGDLPTEYTVATTTAAGLGLPAPIFALLYLVFRRRRMGTPVSSRA